MGRRFPAVVRGSSSSSSSSIYPVESLPLAFMCLTVSASLAVISALCGSRFRRKGNNTTQDKVAEQTSSSPPPEASSSPPRPEPQSQAVNPESSGRVSVDAVIPPPPARRQLDINGSQSMKPKSNAGGVEAGRKLSSMSMSRVGRSLSMSIGWSRKEGGSAAGTSSSAQKMKAKLEKEDSVWMKTIILGEKCRVEDEDDPVIFDDRGLKVTAYHPKVPCSLPVSRSNSCIDQSAIPAKATGEASN